MSERDFQVILTGLLPAEDCTPLARQAARLPDPHAALAALQRLATGAHPVDPWRLQAFLTLAGHSPFLGNLLLQNPDFLEALPSGGPARGPRTREDLEEDLARFRSLSGGRDASALLRRFKQREFLRIALADFLGTADLGAITRALSLLADVLVDTAVRMARGALEARFGLPASRDHQGHLEEGRFAVIALGKLGGEELNYSSDIDLMYLFSRDGETSGTGSEGGGVITSREFFTRLATDVTRMIAGRDPEGQAFRVDLGLRPGGRDGALVISLGAAIAYYRNWAEAWERQALIKARPSAGDLDLGRRFVEGVEPLVYASSPDPYLALEIGSMKDRIDAQLSSEGRAETDVKLGRGGIRELEFAVQALQLQHGGRDAWLRHGNTLLALHRLADKGYLAYEEYAALARAYTFLRDLEHRLQLGQDRQTSTLPTEDGAWRGLARRMRLGDAAPGAEGAALSEELERHRRVVRAFYDSVVGHAAQARIDEDLSDPWLDRVDDETLTERLRRSGLVQPQGALRSVKMIRRLLQPAAASPELRRALRKAGPIVLDTVARAPNPKRALDNLEKLLSSLVASPEGLLHFVSHREILGPTVQLLGRSDLLAGLLIRQPGILRRLEDRSLILRTPEAEEYRRSLRDAVEGPGGPSGRSGRLRRRHQETLATIAIRDINRQATLREVLKSLSNLADACLDAATALAREELGERVRAEGPGGGARLAVLGLGRLGYRELDYGSDLDLLFVVEPEEGVGAEVRLAASRWCEEIVRVLSTLSRDGQLYKVDLRLRPSGHEGELVSTPESLRAYFLEEAEVWEMQSFLKARPVAGDLDLGRRTVSAIESLVLDRSREMGDRGISAVIAAMRRRLQDAAGRMPGLARSVKLGAGGILDVHFLIECLQLRHGVRNPADKDTLRLLTHLEGLGLLEDRQLRVLYEGYRFLRALEHEMRLIHDPPLERLPHDPARLGEIAVALDPGAPQSRLAARRLMEAFGSHTLAIRSLYEEVVAPG